MEKKRLPIGISDYKQLIEDDYYFVDKTNLIRQIIEEGSKIIMLPRPRRFGKTLNLSILRYFFEKTENNVYRPLFDGKNIQQWKDFDKYQGQYPVIMITLKDCKADTFEGALSKIGSELQQEYMRHAYLLDSPRMNAAYRPVFETISQGKATQHLLENSLSLLSRLLTAHWGTPPIVLLDEYDTPAHIAFDKGYYDPMISFMPNFMSTVFKDNTDIFKGVITGILRVSKESLFSGLNNISVFSLLSRKMPDAFGFTQEETDRLLDDYQLSAQKEEVKKWYDGYLFGGKVIYNPWSLLNYVNNEGEFSPYWVNTGSDVLLSQLIADGPSNVRREIEVFLNGGTIRCAINDKLSFPDLTVSSQNIWSFMLFCGYLNASEPAFDAFYETIYTLRVPNREIAFVYRNIIRSWIDGSPVKNQGLEQMLQALLEGDIRLFERALNEFVVNTLSYYDTSGRDVEKVYQAFLLGMLINLSDYEVSSNREAGLGRYDILLRPRDTRQRGIIMELKVCDPAFGDTVEEVLASALQQIDNKQYAAVLHAAGIQDILCMAVTFDGKRVWVKVKE